MRSSQTPNPAGREEITWDFEGTRRHHIRLGLQMTPAERLRWLEDTVEEMRQLQGLARKSQKKGSGRDGVGLDVRELRGTEGLRPDYDYKRLRTEER